MQAVWQPQAPLLADQTQGVDTRALRLLTGPMLAGMLRRLEQLQVSRFTAKRDGRAVLTTRRSD
jgi:hypothetical protein